MNVALAEAPLRPQAVERCASVLRSASKSFALAARLLPRDRRDEVAVLYAYCRHVDDAIDLAPREERHQALARLRLELERVYRGERTDDTLLDAFAEVARARKIPRVYFDELLAGMEMDVLRRRYDALDDLLLYAYRVAGTVGAMLCHVMGLSDERALRNAAHLGIAMQLTNICRDVAEDLADGRVYLPREMLPLGPSPNDREDTAAAVNRLLAHADAFYRSADRGVRALPFRCALAVHAARRIYAAIGDRLRARGCDPFRGRAFVPLFLKLVLVLFALAAALREIPARLRARRAHLPPERVLRFPDDVLPL